MPEDMVRMISAAGREPVRRNTLYGVLERYENKVATHTDQLGQCVTSGVRLIATSARAIS